MSTTPNRGSEPAMPGFSYTDGHGSSKPILTPAGHVVFENYVPGLTIREHFAGLAMQGWMSSFAGDPDENRVADFMTPEHTAKEAVKFADALIAELAK